MRLEKLQMLKLDIPNYIFELMLAQAEAEAPIEACGILAGTAGNVEKFYQMTNIDQSATHFMLEPKEQFSVIKDIRTSSLEMLAIYHSHPASPARPSAEDIRMALTPDVVYVIVSLNEAEPVVKGFLIEDGNINEVPVRIEKE